MPSTSYDCYQINIQVNLSEEDSCLYKRYQTAMFSIKNCSCADLIQKTCNEQIVNPDASILNIELDNCDHTKAIFSLYVKLPYIESTPSRPGYFDNQTFCISSGSSGIDLEIMTFEVAPLPANVVSTGIINKCNTYEIMRVPNRTVHDILGSCNNNTTNNFINGGCTQNPGIYDGNLFFVADTLNVVIPLTKELKTFYLNNGASDGVLVRIVSCGASKFCIPATLHFDIDKCTVCLKLSIDFIINMFKNPNNYSGYIHMFKCMSDNNIIDQILDKYNSAQDLTTTTTTTTTQPQPDYALYACLGNMLFTHIAGKKINVMGVNKCSETVLYNFTICYFPYIGYTINNCGGKPLGTTADSLIEIYGDSLLDFEPENSFKIESHHNYSYKFLVENKFIGVVTRLSTNKIIY